MAAKKKAPKPVQGLLPLVKQAEKAMSVPTPSGRPRHSLYQIKRHFLDHYDWLVNRPRAEAITLCDDRGWGEWRANNLEEMGYYHDLRAYLKEGKAP